MKRPVGVKMDTRPIVAREVVFARLIATAAATETPPSLVSELGVLSPPSLAPPPLLEWVVSRKPRCDATWSETPVPGCPPLVLSAGAPALPDESSGAPAADAFAVAELSDEPCAASVMAPPALRLRRSVASVLWFAIVSASETPTAALLPCASPSAVVFADAD